MKGRLYGARFHKVATALNIIKLYQNEKSFYLWLL